MEMETLRDLYVEELKDLWSAENQILKALPRMIKAATHPKLKKAFAKHERQTQRAREAARAHLQGSSASARAARSASGMEGLIEEGKDLIKEKPDKDVLDAGLISAAQHVEHYEMAGYGTCRTWARLLGYDDQARLLQTTLDEEQQTDLDLTALAESSINIEAADHEEESSREAGDSAHEAPARGGRGDGGLRWGPPFRLPVMRPRFLRARGSTRPVHGKESALLTITMEVASLAPRLRPRPSPARASPRAARGEPRRGGASAALPRGARAAPPRRGGVRGGGNAGARPRHDARPRAARARRRRRRRVRPRRRRHGDGGGDGAGRRRDAPPLGHHRPRHRQRAGALARHSHGPRAAVSSLLDAEVGADRPRSHRRRTALRHRPRRRARRRDDRRRVRPAQAPHRLSRLRAVGRCAPASASSAFTRGITVDGVTHEVETSSVLVANFGIGARRPHLLRRADRPPGRPARRVHLLAAHPGATRSRIFWRMLFGGVSDDRCVRILPGAHIRIETDPPRPMQADGELLGLTPVEIHVEPGAVRLLSPAAPRAAGDSAVPRPRASAPPDRVPPMSSSSDSAPPRRTPALLPHLRLRVARRSGSSPARSCSWSPCAASST